MIFGGDSSHERGDRPWREMKGIEGNGCKGRAWRCVWMGDECFNEVKDKSVMKANEGIVLMTA